jgi:hypothetical protein
MPKLSDKPDPITAQNDDYIYMIRSGSTYKIKASAIIDLAGGLGSPAKIVNHQSGTTYTLQATDNNALITFDNAEVVMVTLPPDLTPGFYCSCYQKGSGQVRFEAPHGAQYINNYSGYNATLGPKSVVDIYIEENIGGNAASYILEGSRMATIDPPDTRPLLEFLEANEEAVTWAFLQEDVSPGLVSAWTSRGFLVKNATQATAGLQPSRLVDYGGVKLTKDSLQYLTWPVDNNSVHLHRWGMIIARADIANNTSQADIQVFYINGISGGASYRQPYVYFHGPTSTMRCQWNDGAYTETSVSCRSNFSEWNVMVWFRRGGYLHCYVNGVAATPVALKAPGYNNSNSASILGSLSTAKADIAIDCVLMGQGYITDAFAQKLCASGMWRVGTQAILPGGNPYIDTPPTFSDADLWTRFSHDPTEWTIFLTGTSGNSNTANVDDPTRFGHRGEAEPARTGYVNVFFDDFVTNTLVDSQSGARASNWYAPYEINPGANVNVNALNATLTDGYGCYVHDASGTGSIKIRLLYANSQWRSGSFGTNNRTADGRWFKLPFLREIKFRFNVPATIGGFFPAFWSYSEGKYLWRTRSPLELDDWEGDGKDASWLNSSVHVHNPDTPGNYTAPGITADTFEKVAGYQLNPTKQMPYTMNWFDGNWHTVTTKIEVDFTYQYIDGYEVTRYPTVHPLFESQNIIVDFAYRSADGAGNTAHVYEMEIDYIKLMKPASSLDSYPVEYTARPTLAGSFVVGQTITCTPNVTSSQIEYLWYRSDGTPIPGVTANTYVLTSAEVGKGIRVNVRAWALKDCPEAWTALSADVT